MTMTQRYSGMLRRHASEWEKQAMPVQAEITLQAARHMEELQTKVDAITSPWQPMRTAPKDGFAVLVLPDCYGIRQLTDDEGVEEWEDIRTSPDVAREEADDMMATGLGEIYEVVPLWTTPHPAPAHQPLTDEQIQDLLGFGNPTEQEIYLIRLGWNAAHGIGGDKP